MTQKAPEQNGYKTITLGDKSSTGENIIPPGHLQTINLLQKYQLLSEDTGVLQIKNIEKPKAKTPHINFRIALPETDFIIPLQSYAKQLLTFNVHKDNLVLKSFLAEELDMKVKETYTIARKRLTMRSLGRFAWLYTWGRVEGFTALTEAYSPLEIVQICSLKTDLKHLILMVQQQDSIETIENFEELPDSWLDQLVGTTEEEYPDYRF